MYYGSRNRGAFNALKFFTCILGLVSCHTEDLYDAVNKFNNDFKDMPDQEQAICLMETIDGEIVKQYDFFPPQKSRKLKFFFVSN